MHRNINENHTSSTLAAKIKEIAAKNKLNPPAGSALLLQANTSSCDIDSEDDDMEIMSTPQVFTRVQVQNRGPRSSARIKSASSHCSPVIIRRQVTKVDEIKPRYDLQNRFGFSSDEESYFPKVASYHPSPNITIDKPLLHSTVAQVYDSSDDSSTFEPNRITNKPRTDPTPAQVYSSSSDESSLELKKTRKKPQMVSTPVQEFDSSDESSTDELDLWVAKKLQRYSRGKLGERENRGTRQVPRFDTSRCYSRIILHITGDADEIIPAKKLPGSNRKKQKRVNKKGEKRIEAKVDYVYEFSPDAEERLKYLAEYKKKIFDYPVRVEPLLERDTSDDISDLPKDFVFTQHQRLALCEKINLKNIYL